MGAAPSPDHDRRQHDEDHQHGDDDADFRTHLAINTTTAAPAASTTTGSDQPEQPRPDGRDDEERNQDEDDRPAIIAPLSGHGATSRMTTAALPAGDEVEPIPGHHLVLGKAECLVARVVEAPAVGGVPIEHGAGELPAIPQGSDLGWTCGRRRDGWHGTSLQRALAACGGAASPACDTTVSRR